MRSVRRKSDSLRQKFGSVSQKSVSVRQALSRISGSVSRISVSVYSETRNTPHCTLGTTPSSETCSEALWVGLSLVGLVPPTFLPDVLDDEMCLFLKCSGAACQRDDIKKKDKFRNENPQAISDFHLLNNQNRRFCVRLASSERVRVRGSTQKKERPHVARTSRVRGRA